MTPEFPIALERAQGNNSFDTRHRSQHSVNWGPGAMVSRSHLPVRPPSVFLFGGQNPRVAVCSVLFHSNGGFRNVGTYSVHSQPRVLAVLLLKVPNGRWTSNVQTWRKSGGL